MTYEVVFRPQARDELTALYLYIAERSGHAISGEFVDRIEAACMALAAFPNRGTPRNDLAPGIRSITMDRKVTIAFRVRRRQVEIVALAYSGRQFGDLKSQRDDD